MGNLSPVATPRIHSVASNIRTGTKSLYGDVTLENFERLSKQGLWDELDHLLNKKISAGLNFQSHDELHFIFHKALLRVAPVKILRSIVSVLASITSDDGSTLISFQNQYNGLFPIHIAVTRYIQTDVILFLIELDVDCCKRFDKDGNLPLHLAVQHYANNSVSDEFIELLIQFNVDAVRTRTKHSGLLPLHIASTVHAMKSSIAEKIMDEYPSALTEFCSGKTPLHYACQYRLNTTIIKRYLLQNEEICHLKGLDSMLPIHMALSPLNNLNFGVAVQIETLQELIRLHPGSLLDRDAHMKIPLHYALELQSHSSKTVANVELAVNLLIEVCPSSAACRNKAGSPGNLPLHIAIEKHFSFPVINNLLNAYKKAALVKNLQGRLPFRSAMEVKNKSDVNTLLALLAANPIAAQEKDEFGRLSLHYATSRNMSVHFIRELLAVDLLSAAVADNNGQLPLHLAIIRCCDTELILCLLEAHPAGLTTLDKYGCLPLYYAIEYGASVAIFKLLLCPHGKVTESLIRQSAMIRKDGKLPLHAAIEFKLPFEKFNQILVAYPEAGALCEESKGRISLSYAIERELPEDILTAIEDSCHESGAFVKDINGLLPIHYAIRYKVGINIVRRLISVNKDIVTNPSYFVHMERLKAKESAQTANNVVDDRMDEMKSTVSDSVSISNYYLLLHYAIEEKALPLTVGEILLLTMPYSHITGQLNPSHYFTWNYVVCQTMDAYWESVEYVLGKYDWDLALIRKLYEFPDQSQRKVMENGGSKSCKAILRRLYFYSRYEFLNSPHIPTGIVHNTGSTMIRFAMDTSENNSRETVALKFMKSKSAFIRELSFYENKKDILSSFSSYTSNIFSSVFKRFHNGDDDLKFREELIQKDLNDYKYCVVMQTEDRDFKSIILNEWSSYSLTTALTKTKEFGAQILKCISILHGSDYIHGNLKPSHILRRISDGKLVLSDFGCAVSYKHHELAVIDNISTAYIAPELVPIVQGNPLTNGDQPALNAPASLSAFDSNENIKQKVRIVASPSMDMWSFGAILYYLLTSEPLFLASSTDNIDTHQMELLASWPESIKQARINKIKDPYAQNLMSQLLMKDPKLRPSADYCLNYHPFFQHKLTSDSAVDSTLTLNQPLIARFPFIASTIDTFISYRAALPTVFDSEQLKQSEEVSDAEHANILKLLLSEREFSMECSSSNSSYIIDTSMAIKLSNCSSSLIVLSRFAFLMDNKTEYKGVDLEDSVVMETLDKSQSDSKEEAKMNSEFIQFVFEIMMMMEFKSRGLLEKGMFVLAVGDRILNDKSRQEESSSVHLKAFTKECSDIMCNGYIYDSYFKIYAGEIVGKFGGSHSNGLHDLPVPMAVGNAVKEVLHTCGYGVPLHGGMSLHQIFSTLLNLPTFHIIGESGDAFLSAASSISAVIDGSMIAMDAYDAVQAVSEHYRGNRPLTSAFSQMIAGRVQSTPQVLLSPAGGRHRSSFASSPSKLNSMSRQSSFRRSPSQGSNLGGGGSNSGGGLIRSKSKSSLKGTVSFSGAGVGAMGESSFFSSSFRTASLFDQEYGLTVSLESDHDDEKDTFRSGVIPSGSAENDVNEEVDFPMQMPYFTEIVGEDKASTSATMVYLAEKLEVKENEVLNLEDEIQLLQEKLQLQSEELKKLRSRYSQS